MTLITCIPSVNLPGAPQGSRVLVDPDLPEIKVLLERELLVREPIARTAEGPAPEPLRAPDALAATRTGNPSPTPLGAGETRTEP